MDATFWETQKQAFLGAANVYRCKLACKLGTTKEHFELEHFSGAEGRLHYFSGPHTQRRHELGWWAISMHSDGSIHAGAWFEVTGFLNLADLEQ